MGNSANAVGSVTQGAGSLTVSPAESFRLGNAAGASGAFTLSGANSSLSTGFAYVGYDGSGSFTNSRGLYLGFTIATAYGTYTLSGGSLTTAITALSGSTSSFTQSGGTHTTGTLTVSDYFPTANVAYHLGGGILAANNVTRLTGTGVFDFTPVPEPGTWAILLMGTGSLWLVALRRLRRTAA